ncbi:MAG: class I SAM-dependent methyltransferase, partial [Deltaproteobacteria bacterium]|nr:class I SAM-dependent methyltransferase [Deltaproteobacteria bacterium]
MGYTLNTTNEYHRQRLQSLGWELTVCNALYPENSLCRSVLKSNASFGEHLFDFLSRLIPFSALRNVLEVGGGLGYLMKDLLRLAPHLQATMLDISPFLLQKQMEALAGLPVRFVEMDFLKVTTAQIHSFDLAIFNENLGDFPTLVYNPASSKEDTEVASRSLNKIFDYEEEYSLEFT